MWDCSSKRKDFPGFETTDFAKFEPSPLQRASYEAIKRCAEEKTRDQRDKKNMFL